MYWNVLIRMLVESLLLEVFKDMLDIGQEEFRAGVGNLFIVTGQVNGAWFKGG